MIDIYGHLTPEERLDKAAEIIAIGLLRLAAKLEKAKDTAEHNQQMDVMDTKQRSA